MLIGNIYPSMGQNGNIYTTDNLSPSIISGVGVKGRGIGCSNAPKILVLDDYNGMVHGEDTIGSVTTTWGHSALRNGWKILEIYETEDSADRQDMEKRG
jgi:hypothetical protein